MRYRLTSRSANLRRPSAWLVVSALFAVVSNHPRENSDETVSHVVSAHHRHVRNAVPGTDDFGLVDGVRCDAIWIGCLVSNDL